MSTDEILGNFRHIKEQIRMRGTASVAEGWVAADHLPTVALLRSLAGMLSVTLDHLDDRVLEGWLAGARQALNDGVDPGTVRQRLGALVVMSGREQ